MARSVYGFARAMATCAAIGVCDGQPLDGSFRGSGQDFDRSEGCIDALEIIAEDLGRLHVALPRNPRQPLDGVVLRLPCAF